METLNPQEVTVNSFFWILQAATPLTPGYGRRIMRASDSESFGQCGLILQSSSHRLVGVNR